MLAALLLTTSVVTMLVSGWMAIMYLLLRHAHYAERAVMAGIVCAGAAWMAAGGWRGAAPVRATLAVWAIALLALGLWALFGSGGDDGWVLIAGTLFVVEGALSLACLLRATAAAGTA
jgi:hypothetical protein